SRFAGHAGCAGDLRELSVGGCGCDAVLRVKYAAHEFPKAVVTLLSHAIGILRRLLRPVVHRQWKALEHELRLGLFSDQPLQRGECDFAMRTLQIAELHDLNRSLRGALQGSLSLLFQHVALGSKRIGAERDGVAENGMTPIRSDVE